MTVRQLIAKLKKMPPHLEVMTQDQDTDEHDLSGSVCSVYLWVREDVRPDNLHSKSRITRETFESSPARCVVLRG